MLELPTAPTHSPRITRLQEEMRIKVLYALQQQPDMNQRQLGSGRHHAPVKA